MRKTQTITVSNKEPRRDVCGAILDAHDGCMEYFEGKYYLYGVRFGHGDGFGETNKFVCYSSADLVHWTAHGVILPEMEKCARTYYQCYVKYNARDKRYVLWYNAAGMNGVAVAQCPQGPFRLINADVQLAHSDIGVGDISLFVDDDGSGYLLYSARFSGDFDACEEPIPHHMICIERLTDDYLASTGKVSQYVAGNCEGPSMIKRGNVYYLLFDNTCCYCSNGTGVRVYVSDTPMGNFCYRGNINVDTDRPESYANGWTYPGTGRADSIVQAQGKHVAKLPAPQGDVFIWMGDRWHTAPDGIKGHDFQYWSSPLKFREDGMIEQFVWEDEWSMEIYQSADEDRI